MRAALLLLLSSLAYGDAHVIYKVKRGGAPLTLRAELWVGTGRAHLRMPGMEAFWDLVKERRLDLVNGRSRDQPISFGRMVQREELFPRGLPLKKKGHKKVLGRTCQVSQHKQEVPTATATVKSQSTWCVWKGVPLQLDYVENVCKKRRCKKSTARWQAVQLESNPVSEADLQRPTR